MHMTTPTALLPKKKAQSHPEMDALADQIGDFIQSWGFKKIHGRIWTHLFLSGVPLDATTLVKRLGVSKALISFSVHDLLEYEVIREVARGRGRTVLYEANPNVTAVIMSVLRQRERKLMAQVMSACQQLETAPSVVRQELNVHEDKLRALKGMIGSAQGALDFILQTATDEKDLFNGLNEVMKMCPKPPATS